jgi:Tol biopolymer transport system component
MNRTQLGCRFAVFAGLVLMSIVRVRTQPPVNAIEAVSVSDTGASGNDSSQFAGFVPGRYINNDGRFIVFASEASNLVGGDSNNMTDIFLRDRLLRKTIRVSVAANGEQANGDSQTPVISGDGRFVAFTSTATNLVPGDTNGVADIFLFDRDTDGNGVFDEPGGTSLSRVSVATDGSQSNCESAEDATPRSRCS